MVQPLLRLQTAGDIRKTLEALDKACYVIYRNHKSEIDEKGNTDTYSWGYVVRVVQKEVETRVGTPDLGEQIKNAAAQKGMKAKSAKAGQP